MESPDVQPPLDQNAVAHAARANPARRHRFIAMPAVQPSFQLRQRCEQLHCGRLAVEPRGPHMRAHTSPTRAERLCSIDSNAKRADGPGMAPARARAMRTRRSSAIEASTWSFAAAMLVACSSCGGSEDRMAAATSGSGGTSLSVVAAGVGGGLEDKPCATAKDQAKVAPVDIYIMFDKSASMQGAKWQAATKAMSDFFSAKQNAGLRVALRFFPDNGCDETCSVKACATPEVSLGELSDQAAPQDVQEQALISALAKQSPSGNTPTSAALDGAYAWAEALLSSQPADKIVVVLITDGSPTDCNTNGQYLVDRAKLALQSRGVLTFVVGLEGSDANLLHAVAKAGGTKTALLVSTANAQAELQNAFDAIKKGSVSCEYLMPKSAPDTPIDPAKVNVIYQPNGGSQKTVVGKVSSKASCTVDKGGWYYDDPKSPTKIVFCPATCALVQSDEKADIEVLIGCTTIPI
jgi:hypothetical protein